MSSFTLNRCRVVPIPGPPGPAGANGINGTNGSNGWASLTAPFSMPAISGTGVAVMDHTDWLALGEPIFIEGLGTLEVTGINGHNVTLLNLADILGNYPFNALPGTVAPSTSRVTPSGFSFGGAGALTPQQIADSFFKKLNLSGGAPASDGSVQALIVWDLDTGFVWWNIGTFALPTWSQH